MPELSLGVFVNHLFIRKGCLFLWIPVDDTFTAVNKSVMKKADKCFQDTIGFTALIVLLLSQACMFLKLEPFYTWFYLFAWWSYIIFIDSILYKFKGNSLIRSRGKEILILSAWSATFWFIFETVNFFVKNWYYINLPADDFLRICGIILAFATVLPGIFITSELLEISMVYKSISIKRFKFNYYVLWIF